jgi:hypothetical protein
MRRIFSASVALLMLGGCEGLVNRTLDSIDPPKGNRSSNFVGTGPVVSRNDLNAIDLGDLIARNTPAACKPATAAGGKAGPATADPTGELTEAMQQGKVRDAFAAFNLCTAQSFTGKAGSPSLAELRLQRNAIQAEIMATADRRCEVYKQLISSTDSNANFGFGIASTASGVLGSLFAAAETSRSLAAAAGFFSGARAEYSRSFFQDAALPVIYTGIDLKRLDIASGLGGQRKKNPDEYSLAQAIGDATRYNGACSATEGLKHVKDRIDGRSVGVDEAARVMRGVMLARAEMRALTLPQGEKKPAMEEVKELRDILRDLEEEGGEKTAATAKDAAPEAPARLSAAALDDRRKKAVADELVAKAELAIAEKNRADAEAKLNAIANCTEASSEKACVEARDAVAVAKAKEAECKAVADAAKAELEMMDAAVALRAEKVKTASGLVDRLSAKGLGEAMKRFRLSATDITADQQKVLLKAQLAPLSITGLGAEMEWLETTMLASR